MEHKAFTISELARQTRTNRRTLRRALETFPADSFDDTTGWRLYRLRTARTALARRTRETSVPTPLRAEKLFEEVRRLTMHNDRTASMHLVRAEVLRADEAMIAKWKSIGDYFPDKYAPLMQGLDIAECRAVVRDMMSELGEVLRNLRDE